MADCGNVPPGNVERRPIFTRTAETLRLGNPLAVKVLLERLLGVDITLNHLNHDLPIIIAAQWEIDRLVKLLQEGN